MAFRLIRLYTGDDGESHFEEGTLALPRLEGTAHRSRSWDAADVSFVESPAGSSSDWHCDPARQYVITLSGTLEFETRLGETSTLAPGTVLLAEEIGRAVALIVFTTGAASSQPARRGACGRRFEWEEWLSSSR